jgi:hypothetical protein
VGEGLGVRAIYKGVIIQPGAAPHRMKMFRVQGSKFRVTSLGPTLNSELINRKTIF